MKNLLKGKKINIKKVLIVFLFSIFLILNLSFSLDFFKKRIDILIYNPYSQDLKDWPGRLVLDLDKLNLTSCSNISLNSSLLVDSFNNLVPFSLYCDEINKKITLFYSLPSIKSKEIKRLYLYYKGKNDIKIVKEPLKIKKANVVISGTSSCQVNLTFPLPALKFNYNIIEFRINGSIQGSTILPFVQISAQTGKCYEKKVLQTTYIGTNLDLIYS
ncbi:MAG: hypothetical protein ABGW69_00335, partial [Nanoarchaeota archaeon]